MSNRKISYVLHKIKEAMDLSPKNGRVIIDPNNCKDVAKKELASIIYKLSDDEKVLTIKNDPFAEWTSFDKLEIDCFSLRVDQKKIRSSNKEISQ